MMLKNYLGPTFLIAGTAIGAAMTALPLSGYTIGLGASLVMLIAVWGLMYGAGIINVQINPKMVSFPKLCEEHLGRSTAYVCTFLVFALCQALLCAYITGLTSILSRVLPIPPWVISVGMTCVLGGIIASGIKNLEKCNSIIFVGKIILLLGLSLILIFLRPISQYQSFLPSVNQIHVVYGVFFTAFGFHGSIPSILGHVRAQDRSKVIFWGSFLPLLFYVLWVVAAFPLKPYGDIGAMIDHVSGQSGIRFVSDVCVIGTGLSIVTSFFGVGLSAFHMCLEKQKKLAAAVISFFPPLLFSIFFPEKFIAALSFAGIILVFLAIILPCLIAFKQSGAKLFTCMMFLLGIVSLVLIA